MNMKTKIFHSEPLFQYGLRQVAITKYKSGELIGSKQDFYENIEAVYICVDKKYVEIVEVLFGFCEKNVRYLRNNNIISNEVKDEIKTKASKKTCRELGIDKPINNQSYKNKYFQNLYKFVYWDFIQRHTLEQVQYIFNNLKQ